MSDGERPFGWVDAIGRGLLVLGIGIGVLVIGPQLILTRVTGLARSDRVALVSGWFTVWLVLLAVGLRRLQERRTL